MSSAQETKNLGFLSRAPEHFSSPRPSVLWSPALPNPRPPMSQNHDPKEGPRTTPPIQITDPTKKVEWKSPHHTRKSKIVGERVGERSRRKNETIRNDTKRYGRSKKNHKEEGTQVGAMRFSRGSYRYLYNVFLRLAFQWFSPEKRSEKNLGINHLNKPRSQLRQTLSRTILRLFFQNFFLSPPLPLFSCTVWYIIPRPIINFRF